MCLNFNLYFYDIYLFVVFMFDNDLKYHFFICYVNNSIF